LTSRKVNSSRRATCSPKSTRTYQARLDQTEATLSHDQAHLENAQTNLQRYSELAKEKSTALERVSNQQADVDELNAQINLDQAAIDNAKAELSYTSLVAPFDGVTGFRGIIGIILLIGIVKKNGIMLVDFTLAGQRERGLSSGDAIHEACRLRFRPILMTTLCALLGGMPLMLGTGTGSEIRQPLGLCDCRWVAGLAAADAVHYADRLHLHGSRQRLALWSIALTIPRNGRDIGEARQDRS
jgi:hypothetical protein